MSFPSPTRNGQPAQSPERHTFAKFLDDNRNDELSHHDALQAAQAEHERVRAAAVRVYQLHELELRHQQILEQERKEEERLAAEARLVEEEMKLRELRAASVPKPPPEPIPEPAKEPQLPPPSKQAAPPEPVKPTPAPTQDITPAKQEPAKPVQAAQLNGAAPPQNNPFQAQPVAKPNVPSQSGPAPAPAPAAAAVPAPAPRQAAVTGPAPKAAPQTLKQGAAVSLAARQAALVQRYTEIHQELKKLRRDLQTVAKSATTPLKTQVGISRREIRTSIGQLTGGKGANAAPMNRITTALHAALTGNPPSPMVNVHLFVVKPPDDTPGAVNNGPELPALFIYLVNICAKAIVRQFVNECGANPKAADPIGVFTAQLFSNREFFWREKSLIDILMAKFCIACPVLFGRRGNDRMERGRLALGWKRDGPGWETEQSHNDRMTGLGAGYAAVSLRDFSKASKTNPYPPANYWMALSSLVNTPQEEVSNTHFIVVRAMIQGFEQRFLTFYGNAGLAALQMALIEFPKKAPKNAGAVGPLMALADVLRKEEGLVLN